MMRVTYFQWHPPEIPNRYARPNTSAEFVQRCEATLLDGTRIIIDAGEGVLTPTLAIFPPVGFGAKGTIQEMLDAALAVRERIQ